MKKYLPILTFLLFPVLAKAQQSLPDSLRKELRVSTSDSAKFRLNVEIGNYFFEKQMDSTFYYGDQALKIARQNKNQLSIARALLIKAFPLNTKGKYGEALECLIEIFTITEDPASEVNSWPAGGSSSQDLTNLRLTIRSTAHHINALIEAQIGNIDQELFHYEEEIRIAEKINNDYRIQVAYMNLGNTYGRLDNPKRALYYGLKADSMAKSSGILYYNGWNLNNIGNVYFKRKEYNLAKKYFYEAYNLSEEKENAGSFLNSTINLFNLYLEEKNVDSCLYFANHVINSTKALRSRYLTFAYENFFEAYSLSGIPDSSNKYLKLAFLTRDSFYQKEIKNLQDFQFLSMHEQLRLRELERESSEYRGKITTYLLLAGLCIFLIIALLLYRNNRQKKRSNKILNNTLTNLKSTQSQLIQSEKMASLGELTAGIAHEIQNPLNFVNNFSEVNSELIVEAESEINIGNIEETKSILLDIKNNEQKITHHGKRADAIVKSMLQHSRTSSGEKESTDINLLCDEYMRLAYHGLRAKDNSFQASFETEFDPTLAKINIIPQDMGRVLLNLINNAFQAVDERSKKNEKDYQPKVTIQTKQLDGKIEITVNDNGNGIPNSIKEKIFQPFFTTKPTGQGTGLGLSLSYDIVKAHGGELEVETKESNGAEFKIILPI